MIKLTHSVARLTFIILSLSFSAARAQTGTWRTYMSYFEPQQIVKGDNQLYVRASNDLYSYSLTDHSITTYDKVNALSDTYITHIAWNDASHRLVIVYQNSNLDLMDRQGRVTNLSALYTKSMTQDKTVNAVHINAEFAYLATGFGVVKVNTQRAEVAETYILNENITAVAVADGNVYVRTAEGRVLSGSQSQNLIDSHNWHGATAPAGLFDQDLTDWQTYLPTVSTLQPGGPKYNNFGFMRFKNGRLYTSGAGYNAANDLRRPATIQLLQGDTWTILAEVSESQTGVPFIDMMAIDADPADPDHIVGGSRTGVYEFQDGNFTTLYNTTNSALQFVPGTNQRYVLVLGLTYDAQGNLWMLQSQMDNNSLVLRTADGQWHAPRIEALMDKSSLNHLSGLVTDSRGLLWMVNDYWEKQGIFCYDPATQAVVHSFRNLVNQDGTSYSTYQPHCIAEDLDGNIWMGTSIGTFMLESASVGSDVDHVTQIKVPRNDGSNYADYLLSGVNVSSIAIDGGGRKWVGTYGAGVYLISADNMTQVLNFTTENSPLLSDNVESIAINNTTGEVFFGTENGLCSYMSDATQAALEMVKDDVYAYPNPVSADYDGLITVVGLSYDADVKILTTNGQLVSQGRSNGGTFTWDGRDRAGRRVASGIYMVAAATRDGKKGTVCKIAVIR